MELGHFWKRVVEYGKKYDPRPGAVIKSFEDSAILYGTPRTRVRTLLVGIDIEVGELLLADKLRQKRGLDLVVAHHPEGPALAGLQRVMQLQVDVMARLGIPRDVARDSLAERRREVERRILPQNIMQAVDAARLLELPFVCIHTPADNHVAWFITELLKRAQPKRVSQIVDILMELPEYAYAAGAANGPRVILGSPARTVGRVFVDMTGGTEGPKDIFDRIYKAGIRTLVCMHLSEEHFKKVRDADLNVVIAGHISSDTLGLNLLLDNIEKEERLDIIECSGFRRFRRKA